MNESYTNHSIINISINVSIDSYILWECQNCSGASIYEYLLNVFLLTLNRLYCSIVNRQNKNFTGVIAELSFTSYEKK